MSFLSWESHWKYPIKRGGHLKAQNYERSNTNSFHTLPLIFKDVFTNGTGIIYWFPASARVPRSLWQPHAEAHFPSAVECMLPSSVPTTLGTHHVPVILPTLWHVFLYPSQLPHPLPMLTDQDPCILNFHSSVQIFKSVPTLLTFGHSAGVEQDTSVTGYSVPLSTPQCFL